MSRARVCCDTRSGERISGCSRCSTGTAIELDVDTLPQEMELAAQDTLSHLERESASLRIDRAERGDGRIVVELGVSNRGGHKLPTAYPSRRVWLHLRVTDY